MVAVGTRVRYCDPVSGIWHEAAVVSVEDEQTQRCRLQLYERAVEGYGLQLSDRFETAVYDETWQNGTWHFPYLD